MPGMTKQIATREELVLAIERMRRVLAFVANQVTTEEGDRAATEEEFGLSVGEVVDMAHDNMIEAARTVLKDAVVKKVIAP